MGSGDASMRRLESGGTPVYDLSHHTWGYDGVNMRRDSTFLSFFVFLLIFILRNRGSFILNIHHTPNNENENNAMQ